MDRREFLKTLGASVVAGSVAIADGIVRGQPVAEVEAAERYHTHSDRIVYLGRDVNSTDDTYVGDIFVWNEELTNQELLALSQGASPLTVRPDAIQAYWRSW